MFKPGDKVKFKDELWKQKVVIGTWGMFGPPLPENPINEFTVTMVRQQDKNEFELQLREYPWLVYDNELEYLKEKEN